MNHAVLAVGWALFALVYVADAWLEPREPLRPYHLYALLAVLAGTFLATGYALAALGMEAP